MSVPRARTASTVVVGGGPAGLMAAETLARSGCSVTIFDAMPSVGRKFLLAGRGGLNLTHSEPLEILLARYGTDVDFLQAAIMSFGPNELREWSASLGETTFVGSSGRVFPASLRATPLLRAWLRRLDELGVERRPRYRWQGWVPDSPTALMFADPDDQVISVHADATIFALGGASWPRTGSNGNWVEIFQHAGIDVTPLRPANCGFTVNWSQPFRATFAGAPVKNIAMSFGGVTIRGEAMISDDGIEGGATYALSRAIRGAIERDATNRDTTNRDATDRDATEVQVGERAEPLTISIDLLPDLDVDEVITRVERRRPKESSSTLLRRLGLPPVSVGLIRESAENHIPSDPSDLARLIKAVHIRLVSTGAIERAISTAGGIRKDQIDSTFMLHRRPGTFVAGEMLDWEAPTGGYLLQATMSTARAAAQGAIAWLNR